MWIFLLCIKGEAGATGIPGIDGRDGHPVSQRRHYSLHRFCRLLELTLTHFCASRQATFLVPTIKLLEMKDLNCAFEESC